MKINRNNYESYFIDYLEGNLDENLVDDFIEFLQINPDLKKELSFFEPVTAEAENIVFKGKEKLYKEKYDSENEFIKATIGSLEGDLPVKEKSEFDEYLSRHPRKKKEVELYSNTKIQPDESIVFKNKNKLYKQTTEKKLLLWSGRIAAALIVALAVYWFTNESTNNNVGQTQIAEVKNNSQKPERPSEQINTQITIETNKEDPPKSKKSEKETIKPTPKKSIKPKSSKSLRETNKGRLEGEDIALIRVPVDVPEKINTLTASIEIAEVNEILARMPEKQTQQLQNIPEERLLADVVKEKTGLENLSLGKITQAGLNLVSSISKDKFTYETNETGKVTELNLDTRLLAFSIPTNKGEGE